MSSNTRAPTENQLSPLHGPHVLITSHNKDGKAIVKEIEPVKVGKAPLLRLSSCISRPPSNDRFAES